MRAKLPEISLIELSELTLLIDFEATLAQLVTRGCDVRYSKAVWQPLSGGRECAQCMTKPVRINGIDSTLVIELSRMSYEPNRAWVDGFDLRPVNQEKTIWVNRIREMISQGFDPPSHGKDGVEIYERGSMEQSILFPGSPTEPAHVLMHRRSLTRNPD